MVDLSGGSEGPLEHAFSNSVFIVPGIIVIGLSDNELRNISLKSLICRKYSPKMDTLDKGTLDKLQELIEASSEPGKQPNRKVLLELLDTVELADDVKENLKAMLTGDVPKVFGGYAGGTILAIVFILLVFAMILFFGYKLYKSIKEKEIKREEKKKAKQMKKKK